MKEYRKKLIEVALPLVAINREAAREKSIRHGHPSTLHLWWARRPLAACRAVLFAQLVDDPSSHPEKFRTEEAQNAERQRLFRLIEELVKWENVNNEEVLSRARAEIEKSTGGNPPPVLDPFCGGGSIPLEAQRLGLTAYASDLNPVAVLITKALIEIPPRFAGRPPIHPGHHDSTYYQGAMGLAEDVSYYGKWMRDQAEERIGHLYPKVDLPKKYGSGKATVIAWLWARTVKCPNPTCGTQMPLVRSFALSTKKGKGAHVAPLVSGNTYRFEVKTGGKAPEGTVERRGARCLCCGSPVPLDHVRAEGKAGRMTARLMAIVAEGQRGRVYLPPSEEQEQIAASAKPAWVPEGDLQGKCRVSAPLYGMNTFADLFTSRQLVALTTFSDLVQEALKQVLKDSQKAGMPNDGIGINDGGKAANAYADAVATYLAFAVDKCTDYWNTTATWMPRGTVGHTFSKQALPMTWDFPEANPLSDFHCAWDQAFEWVAKQVLKAPQNVSTPIVVQRDAIQPPPLKEVVISTDPPYYDNIGYADLSDFFYVWLRPTLKQVYPKLMGTMLVPKSEELVATPYRFDGDRGKARAFFEEGLGKAFERMREMQNPDYPLTVYYAFKQSETVENGDDECDESNNAHASTGWETMLEGLLKAKFSIHGTWPMRTERGARSVSLGTNALASSIVLVCRPRPEGVPMTTRREFLNELKKELPDSLRKLQLGSIAPVDLAQACIGPGMAIFSRHSKILEADGSAMRVRTALTLINQVLDECLTEQEAEYDKDTRWALAWFEQYGMGTGPFGEAEVLCTAKATAVSALTEAGILMAKGGKVRLLRRDELAEDWDPATDKRLTVWEVAQHLIRTLVDQGSEERAAELLRKVGALGETARDLAYRLYTICERKKWAQDALGYNSLVVAWPEMVKLAGGHGSKSIETQDELL